MEIVSTEIKKVSLKNERLEVTMSQEFRLTNESDDTFTDDVTRKSSQIVHKDLKAALDGLKPHLVCICEQKEAEAIKNAGIFDFDVESLDNYIVTGYTIGGTDEQEGITIIGQKLLKSGQVLNLIAPFTKYESEEYSFGGELMTAVEGCNYEVEEYLFNGKWGIKQQVFDFEEENEADNVKVSVSSDGENYQDVDLKKLKKLAKTA